MPVEYIHAYIAHPSVPAGTVRFEVIVIPDAFTNPCFSQAGRQGAPAAEGQPLAGV